MNVRATLLDLTVTAVTILLIVLAVACLAYANGANDNFKGVATLFGSGTADYRGALAWATVTTLAGSLTAVFLAGRLLSAFTGRDLVADSLVSEPTFVAAVAAGAGLTVLLATRLGLPISTTHGLVGALVGTGWAAGSEIDGGRLLSDFFGPLLLSPVAAIVATGFVYLACHRLRRLLGVTATSCFCVGTEIVETVPALSHDAALRRVEQLKVTVGDAVACRNRYQGAVLGIDASAALDRLHYLSAGIVSFARGLNDTPKIAALLLVVPLFGQWAQTSVVGLMMAAGGLLSARRVAELMSRRITPMNPGQGFVANVMTGLIVIGASRLGLPVSTTHVSCGALFGIGAVNRRAEWGTIGKILTAWVTTLPAGAALGATMHHVLRWFPS